MKRLWIGVVLLVLLLAGSLFLLDFSSRFYKDFSVSIEQAGSFALAGDWTNALEHARLCQKKWEKKQHFLAAFTDHEPIEQLDTLFSQLEIYGKDRLPVEFACVCRQLYHLVEAIDESHSLKWWTILSVRPLSQG